MFDTAFRYVSKSTEGPQIFVFDDRSLQIGDRKINLDNHQFNYLKYIAEPMIVGNDTIIITAGEIYRGRIIDGVTSGFVMSIRSYDLEGHLISEFTRNGMPLQIVHMYNPGFETFYVHGSSVYLSFQELQVSGFVNVNSDGSPRRSKYEKFLTEDKEYLTIVLNEDLELVEQFNSDFNFTQYHRHLVQAFVTRKCQYLGDDKYMSTYGHWYGSQIKIFDNKTKKVLFEKTLDRHLAWLVDGDELVEVDGLNIYRYKISDPTTVIDSSDNGVYSLVSEKTEIRHLAYDDGRLIVMDKGKTIFIDSSNYAYSQRIYDPLLEKHDSFMVLSDIVYLGNNRFRVYGNYKSTEYDSALGLENTHGEYRGVMVEYDIDIFDIQDQTIILPTGTVIEDVNPLDHLKLDDFNLVDVGPLMTDEFGSFRFIEATTSSWAWGNRVSFKAYLVVKECHVPDIDSTLVFDSLQRHIVIDAQISSDYRIQWLVKKRNQTNVNFSLDDWDPIEGAHDVFYKPVETGHYTYMVLENDNEGCYSICEPSFFFDKPSSVQYLKEDRLQVYPNPVSVGGTLNIVSDQHIDHIDIISPGQKVVSAYNLSYDGKSYTITLDLKPGIYILHIDSLGYKKIVVQ